MRNVWRARSPRETIQGCYHDATTPDAQVKGNNSILGLVAGDVMAIGLGCPECPVVVTVASATIDTTGSVVTARLGTAALQNLSVLQDLKNATPPQCFARVWLFDTPRFELPLYPALPQYDHMIKLMGWEHAYHGGCYCYETVRCWTLTPHPFLIVNIGTPDASAPYKYYAGTGKAVPITTTLYFPACRVFQKRRL